MRTLSFTSNQITQLGRTIQSQPSNRLLHGNCFTKRQERRLLKTTIKGFQIFDNETAFLLEPFPTTLHTELWFRQHVFVSLLRSAVLQVLTFLRRYKTKIKHLFSTKWAIRDLILQPFCLQAAFTHLAILLTVSPRTTLHMEGSQTESQNCTQFPQ